MSVLQKSEEFENVISWLFRSENYKSTEQEQTSQPDNLDPDAALKEFVVKMCAAILLRSSVQRQEQFNG